MTKILIFIPTYNEAENVPIIYRDIKALNLDADMLFCDDHSPDGTGDIIDQIATTDKRIFVMHRPGKLGIGSAHQDGIRYAYENNYDILVTLDCDFSHSPAYIKDFIAEQNGDIIIGSRYMQKDSLKGWNMYRKVLTHLGHCMTVLLLRMPYDATGAFRLYHLKQIPQPLFSLVRSSSYSFFFESLYLLMVNGFKIVEVPIALPPRTYGHSKMTKSNLVTSLGVLGELFKRKVTDPASFHLPANAKDNGQQIWDAYWNKPTSALSSAYDAVASFYRTAIIRPALNFYVSKYIDGPCARLLHAGCGSGQVEGALTARYNVTALDVSPKALQLYRSHNPQVTEIVQGDIFKLNLPQQSFDGIYNLGVMEHFDEEQINAILTEFNRVLKTKGKIILFWPPAYGLATNALKGLDWVSSRVLRRKERLFPEEVTHVKSQAHAAAILAKSGFRLIGYHFGPRDAWTHAVVVAEKGGANEK